MNTQITSFKDTVWRYYDIHGRHSLPWRQGLEREEYPYNVLVSEIMLQQTQVARVIEKYNEWIHIFPNVQSVAESSLADCVSLWVGLGYNRRVKYLHQACRQIVDQHRSLIPNTQEALAGLPGIGINTAGAILAYSYNQPSVFIETNIRTVYIYHFFANNKELIHDKEILALVEQTLDRKNPREWYWALMDYGSCLKKTVGNVNMQSRHYTVQPKFEGSVRQIRGQVLKLLRDRTMSLNDLRNAIHDERLPEVLKSLEAEGFIEKTGVIVSLK